MVLLAAGPPCQGVSGLNSSRLGAESDERSKLHSEVARVRRLIAQHFTWADTFILIILMESVSSMSASDRVVMSRGVGILPYELDAIGISPCRRPRLFWFNWTIQSNNSIIIYKPITTEPDDYGRIVFLLSCDPSPYLMPGWELAGGSDHKLPIFTTSQPKARSGFQPAEIENCSERDLIYWREDRFKFPPYQYKYVHGLIRTKRGWRLPNIAEREAMMGYPLGYTEQAWSKTRRKQDPIGLDDLRLSRVGNSCSVPLVFFCCNICLSLVGCMSV